MNQATAPHAESREAQQELTFDEALQMAVELHRNNQLDGAVQLYQRLLQAVPAHPDVLHLLGMAHHQMGRSDEGVRLIEQAIEAQPDYAGYFNNLGNIYMSRGEVAKAMGAYQQAVELDRDNADLHNNLGALHKAQRQFDEAHAAYERAIAIDPRHVRAHNNLGLLYAAKGDRTGAISYYIKALELLPGDSSARRLLGTTYYAMGRIADAGEVYRQWLAQEPDHPTARHMYAACTGDGVPERAPDDYVEQAFDHFAESFESVLNERLNYQAPQLCADMMARHLPPPQRQFVMLDAGCGTGLCGPLMAPWAKMLAGVDLSKGMLDRAQTKGVYGDLYKAELTEFLHLSPRQWDVVLSADTLCYFGDLSKVIHEAGASLKPGGTLIFTVEALSDEAGLPHQIQPHGRYAHHRQHLIEVLSAADLNLLDMEAVVLREEGGKPVNGWLIAARQLG
ncbi:tetratricopeptide repeat protein [Aquabacterium sp.]|uniref:tetratricopeptide repeat protein n=1 Tax=Aquabacterium sp. TaxID=1872578 RepID=UPI0025BCDAEA|nr:tetratricopeptide repeat protein [Aquabacterium sp.]